MVDNPMTGAGRIGRLVTPRLELRLLQVGDLADIVTLHSDPGVMLGRNVDATPEDEAAATAAAWLATAMATPDRAGWGMYRVGERATGLFIGRCGLRPEKQTGEPELAYSYLTRAWGRGFATEAASAVLREALAFGITRIVAETLTDNVRSQRVLQKLGFTRCGDVPHSDGRRAWYRFAHYG